MSLRTDRIRTFYEQHRQALFSYALSLAGEAAAAEDLVHGVVEQLLARPLLPLGLRRYAFRCIRNAAVSAWRRDGARRDTYFDFDALPAAAGERGRRERLEAALARLDEPEREAVTLKVFDGLTFREIAAIRRANPNTVASHYRRALEKLRQDCAEDAP